MAPGDRKRQRKVEGTGTLSPPAGTSKATKAAPLSSPVTPAEQTPAPAVIDVEAQGLRKRRQQAEEGKGLEDESETKEAASHKHGRLMEEEEDQEGARGGNISGSAGKGKHQRASPVPIGKATPQKQALRDIPLVRFPPPFWSPGPSSLPCCASFSASAAASRVMNGPILCLMLLCRTGHTGLRPGTGSRRRLRQD